MPDNSADYDEPDDLSADNDDDPDTHQGWSGTCCC